LDTDAGKAYVQNADTNAYLEEQFADMLRLSGGTMTGTIIMPRNNPDASIKNDNGNKIFGFGSDGNFYLGDPEFSLLFRGSATNPKYNGFDMLKVQTGSYTGTGKVGASNPNKITFTFTPKIVIVYETTPEYSDDTPRTMFAIYGLPSTFSSYVANIDSSSNSMSAEGVVLTWTATSLSWHAAFSGTAGYVIKGQLNASGQTYKWIAIG
jgi:hypothetical protein